MDNITVKKSQIEKLLKLIAPFSSDADISFELVISMLFPTVFKNIQSAMHDKYTEGYLQGRNERNRDES